MPTEDVDEFIERRIVIGMIVSTEYLQQVSKYWAPQLLESSTARIVAGWCLDYFNHYHRAPQHDLEKIFYAKLQEGAVASNKVEWVESILGSLSDEYIRGQFNAQYLVDETKKYFHRQNLRNFVTNVHDQLNKGDATRAEQLALSYSPILNGHKTFINPFTKDARNVVKHAFQEREDPLIRFPKALGTFWNNELIRGGFVALTGPEKRGKTYFLMEFAMRALQDGCNTVFFQAGDMTERQLIRRVGIYLAKRSDQPRYCQRILVPTLDCVHNQQDTCKDPLREEGEKGVKAFLSNGISHEALVNACTKVPNHLPCHNCDKLSGSVWLGWREEVTPLTWKEAYRRFQSFETKYHPRFKLSTYPNDTLTVAEIKSLLHIWERQESFVADVIIIDYADILAPDPDSTRMEFRHQTNQIWKRLRGLSEERHCLVITATQAPARSYEKETLTMSDFSEDKRKLGHVTLFCGLNQTPDEKKIGLMRLNEIVVRESDFDSMRTVKVLQRLQMGRPVLGSYW